MRNRYILTLLVVAGCSTPTHLTGTIFPPVLHTTSDTVAAQPTQDTSLPFVVVAEGETPQQPKTSVQATRSPADLNQIWNALTFYSKDKSICPNKVKQLDFDEQSVYLIGIPYPHFTDDPVIDSVTETADAVVVRYHTTKRGQIELPATKTHYLAVAFKKTDKPVRLESGKG